MVNDSVQLISRESTRRSVTHSRRAADQLIAAGRVRVSGEVAELGTMLAAAL